MNKKLNFLVKSKTEGSTKSNSYDEKEEKKTSKKRTSNEAETMLQEE